MNFNVVKKGYDKAQVQEYIQNLTNENNDIITNLKSEIEELKKQKEELSQVVEGYEKKKEEVFVAFVEAQETSAKLKARAERRFAEEMERLQLFQQKWTSYAKQVTKTLAEDQAEQFEQASQKFQEILAVYEKEVKIVQPEQKVQEPQQEKTFNPLKKVAKFLDKFEQPEQKVVKVEQVAIEQPQIEQILVEENQEEEIVVTKAPLELEEVAEELVDQQQIQPVVVEQIEKQDDIKQKVQQLFEEEDKLAQQESNDIAQNEIFNVQQSLEDLCKELGLID